MTFQVQTVVGSGVSGVDPASKAVLLLTSYIEEYDVSTRTAVFRKLALGMVTSSGGVDASLFTCTWSRERAGNYSVAVQLLYPGGLRGDYFGDAWLGEVFDSPSIGSTTATPIVSRIDRQVNFTWNTGPAFPGAQSHFSIRWVGWLKPRTTGSTIIGISVVGYARLWIDDALVIDRWGAGGETSDDFPTTRAAAGVTLDVSKLYSLVLEYRAPRQGDLYVRLLWGSVGSAKLDVIPAEQLFSGSHIHNSPFTNVVVTPALTASTALTSSTLRSDKSFISPALQAVAGETFAFSVLPRDVYGNRRRSPDQRTRRDDIAVRLTLGTDRSLGGQSTKTEDALVSWNGELDVFRVLARPQRSGDYSMVVNINNVASGAGPFAVVVVPAKLNAAKCVLSGPGLLSGRVAGQAITVALETRDLYGNRIYTGGLTELKLQASLLSSVVPMIAVGSIIDNADGTYQFTYTPRIVGSYSVAVTSKGVHLHNSPYVITVVPSTPVGPTSVAQGPGIVSAKTNVQTTFEVTTRDSSGNDVTTGGVASALTVILKHPEKGNVNGDSCTDLLNGHYTCTYTPHYVGLTRLHVLLSQQEIHGSAFFVEVTAGPALGSRCVATGGALVSAVAGQQTSFTVNIYDAFGNAKTNAGSESITATFTGPGAATFTVDAAVAVTYIGRGVYLVAYTLSLKGSYKISVMVDNVAVGSSPFTMYVHPALASPTKSSLDLVAPTMPKTQLDPPVVFTAGVLIVARLTTRDTFGNDLETGGNLFLLDDAVQEFLEVPIADQGAGTYLITLRPKRSVLFPFTPKLMMPGGLNGSYYSSDAVPVGIESFSDHSLLVLKRRDATINFDFGERPPSHTHSAETFSVRWDGFLLPRFSEVYTFEVTVLGFASLRIGSASVTVHEGEARSSIAVLLTAQTFVDLELNFSKSREIPSASVTLAWRSLSQTREIIPSSQLFTSWKIVNNVPPLDVKPATADPTMFTAEFGISLTPGSTAVRAVVDKPLIFSVVARDSFTNKLGGDDLCSLYVLLPQVPSGSQPDVSITDMLDGSYKVNLVPYLIGSFSLYVAALPDAMRAGAPAGGAALVAFLTQYNIKGSPFQLQVDPGLPSAVASTLVGGGFVSTTAGIPTSFVLELRDSSANRLSASMVTDYLAQGQVRVKLRSISAGTEVLAKVFQLSGGDLNVLSARDVRVEYTVTLAGLHAVLLSVNGGNSFSQKTTTLRIYPNVATAVTSFVSPNGAGVAPTSVGLGPQIVSTQIYTYHVTVRDAFGNVRDSGGDLIVARIHGPDSSGGKVTDLGNGDYVVLYRVMLPGAYEIETRVAEPQHGLTGYYYVDTGSFQRNAGGAVRTVDDAIDFDWSKNATMRGYPRVVWRGFLRPLFGEEYTLWVNIQSDVGNTAGVYIDGQAVIDGQNTAATSGRVVLYGGRLHAIVVEYQSVSLQQYPGYLSLYWKSARQSSQLIPTQALIAEASEILPRTQIVAV
ncbi:hypothetical protein DVH05_026653 [Phytophthora capsici]|nr:hypothetical protein DVH05_026653 [Phytophthora capsici]